MKCTLCGKEFPRGITLHEKYCKGIKSTENNIDNTQNKKNTDKKETKKSSCEHNFILLDMRCETHRQAKKSGYNAYCSLCDELT